jgi:hypothetical protein
MKSKQKKEKVRAQLKKEKPEPVEVSGRAHGDPVCEFD